MSIYLPTLDDYVDPDELPDEADDTQDPFVVLSRREEQTGIPLFYMPAPSQLYDE